MDNIIWAVPQKKREQFTTKYLTMIQDVEKELWQNKDYMPYWYSELPYPLFSKAYLNDLPIQIGAKIKNLYYSLNDEI